MKILVTGSNGFIGRNLVAELKNRGYSEVFEFNKETSLDLLDSYCQKAEFIFHLAGSNRPTHVEEFKEVNIDFTLKLIEILKKYKNKCPILFSSSIQAELKNPYGFSKKAAEEILISYAGEVGVNVLIYRFPNIFGKWCKPNYNSVIATFCYNISRDLPIMVSDSNKLLNLLYIDDLVNELINSLEGKTIKKENFCELPTTYSVSLGEIVDLLYRFKNSRENLLIPNMSDEFVKKAYCTYLSYLPERDFSYELKMNIDNRGSFTEFIKAPNIGQVSVNISHPGVVKGNHWHHTKSEKFLVVNGIGVIRFRSLNSKQVIEYFVSAEKLEVIDIPVGYTHNIENLGETDMVTIMWASEAFNQVNPDTYFLEV